MSGSSADTRVAPFSLEHREELRAAALAIVQQAHRSLDIVSRHLDPILYDNEAFVTAVRTLVVGSARARVRFLVLDTTPLAGSGHRLLELAQRLSSFLTLRVPGPEHRSLNEAWLVADETGFLHRRLSDRFEATGSYDDRQQAHALTQRLDAIWERAQAPPHLRRLFL